MKTGHEQARLKCSLANREDVIPKRATWTSARFVREGSSNNNLTERGGRISCV